MSMMVSVIASWLRRWVFVRYENHLHYTEREREREPQILGFWGNTDKRWALVWFGDQIDILVCFFHIPLFCFVLSFGVMGLLWSHSALFLFTKWFS